MIMCSRKVSRVFLSASAVALAVWLGTVALLDRAMRTGDELEAVPTATRWLVRLARPLAARRAQSLACSSTTEDRRRAARALQFADIPDRQQALFELANDPDSDTSALALQSMAAMSDDCADALLDRYAKAEHGEKTLIVRTLSLLGNHRAFELLSSLATDEQYPLLQEEAINGLGRMGSEAIPILTDGLDSRRAEVRARSASALGRIGAPAVPSLKKALLKGDEAVRNRAVDALVAIGAKANQVLVAVLDGEDPYVRHKAAKALIDAHDPLLYDALSVAALDSDDEKVRKYSGRALRGMPDTLAIRLDEALSDTEPNVIIRAARLTGAIRFVGTIPRLCQLLEHDDPEVRAACARALGDLKAGQATPRLIALLNDAVPEVQLEAIFALGEVRDERAVQMLMQALAEAPDSRAEEIRSALTESRRVSLTPLIQALSSNDLQFRRRVIDTLGRTRTAKAIPPLEAILPNADEQTRACIEKALDRLRDAT